MPLHKPVRIKPFPAWPPKPSAADEAALLEVYRSGEWGANQGRVGKAFAADFARRHQAHHGVAVSNGTISLTLALWALGVRQGDEVIVPTYTFIATASSALLIGAIPVFADIDPETLAIDPESVRTRITRKTKAIVAVHIAGRPADLDALREVAAPYNVSIIEDAAQAHGAEWRGTPVGAIGEIGSFSFQSSKNMTSGEGGMLLTNSTSLYDRLWSLQNVGRVPGGEWYQHTHIGWNFRLTEFQAAVLAQQLPTLDDMLMKRDTNARVIAQGLAAEVPGVHVYLPDSRVTRHAWHLFPIRIDPASFGGLEKGELVAELAREGIPANGGYPAINRQRSVLDEIHRISPDMRVHECPVAESLSPVTLWLPQPTLLGDATDCADIVRAFAVIQRRTQSK